MSFFDRPTGLEEWLARELRRPVRMSAAGKVRLLERLRAEKPYPASSPARGRAARTRPLYASPVIGVALAASLVGIVSVDAVRSVADRDARVLPTAADGGLGDTLVAALQDTLRLVRFMLVAPAATRVALVGDFNRWNPRATPLAATEPRGAWSTAVPLGPGRYRYAFVVDDTQWLADPAAPRGSGMGRRHTSVATITQTRN